VRAAVLALVCAVLGGAAAIGIGLAAGLGGGETTKTVVVRESVPSPNTPASVRTVAPTRAPGFSPAVIFARRSSGVVTVFSYFGGTAAQGSGFVVSASGAILTNAHVITNAGETNGVVRPASSVYVEFADHDRVPARVVGWDVFDDVGVLRVAPSAHALVPVPLGHSESVVVGEPVAAIGSPLGNLDSLAVGIVSAVHRSIAALTNPRFQLTDAIQTDAPIAHGSSGGPLLDAGGRAIGITAQIRTDQGGAVGIGFAVPIDSARRSLHTLLTKGHIRYAYVGVQSEDLTPSLARHLQLTVEHGALVDSVSAGGPAAAAGLRGGTHEEQFQGQTVTVGGDVIVAVDGRAIASAADLVRIVTNALRPGQTALFAVVRGSSRRAIAVTVTARSPR
jgi:2-alkenal reductase